MSDYRRDGNLAFDLAARGVSPYDLNLSGSNPLRAILE